MPRYPKGAGYVVRLFNSAAERGGSGRLWVVVDRVDQNLRIELRLPVV